MLQFIICRTQSIQFLLCERHKSPVIILDMLQRLSALGYESRQRCLGQLCLLGIKFELLSAMGNSNEINARLSLRDNHRIVELFPLTVVVSGTGNEETHIISRLAQLLYSAMPELTPWLKCRYILVKDLKLHIATLGV